MENNNLPKVQIKNVYKVFGRNPQRAVEALKKGESKQEILEKYKNPVGINNASFDIMEGELFVIIGLSGSGKSTLVRCLNLLNDVTSGEILIDGENIAKYNKKQVRELRRHKISMVFQKFGLLPHHTILENVLFGLEIKGEKTPEEKERALDIIETVGLAGYEDSYPGSLSGGMQQRVGIARAIASNTDIILMDEAFSALDIIVRKQLQEEIIELQKEMGKTVVFITHDLDEAFKVGDRVAVMKDGVVIQVGTPEEIIENPVDEYVEEFIQDVNKIKIIKAGSIMQEPTNIAKPDDSLEELNEIFLDKHLFNMPVVNPENGDFLGLLPYREVVQAIEEEKSIAKEAMINRGFKKIRPSKRINGVIADAVVTKYPFIVTDRRNKFKGIINKKDILSLLADDEKEVE